MEEITSFPVQDIWPIFIPLVLGIAGIYAFYYKNEQGLRLKDGEMVEGIIEDWKLTRNYGNDDRELYSKTPIIRFTTKKNEIIIKEYDVYHSFMKIGDKVSVKYNPGNPIEFYIVSRSFTNPVYIALILGVISLLIGLFNLVMYLLK